MSSLLIWSRRANGPCWGKKPKHLLAFAVLIASVLATVLSTGADAARLRSNAGLVVNCSADTGALGTALANAAAGDTLKIKGTCLGSIIISKDVTLVGRGNATLDGQGVNGATVLVLSDVTASLANLTVTGGVFGITNAGTLLLWKMHVAGNQTGIDNLDSATLTLVKTKVRDNHRIIGDLSSPHGPIFAVGGIYNSGALTLISSSVRANTASIGGQFNGVVGGILTVPDPVDVQPRSPLSVSLIDSKVIGNSAVSTGLDNEVTGGFEVTFGSPTVFFFHSVVARNTPNNCLVFVPDPACR